MRSIDGQPCEQCRSSSTDTLLCVWHCAGGKWTTYRRMAEDALNTAVEVRGIPTTRQCMTSTLKLLGGQQYKPGLHTEVRGLGHQLPGDLRGLAAIPGCT